MLTWLNLKSKLMFIFVSLLLIPVIGVGLFGHFFLSNTLLQNAIDSEQEKLQSKALRIGDIFTESRNSLIYLSEIRTLKSVANIAPDSSLYQSALQALQQDFEAFASTHPMYETFAFYNVIGQATVLIESDLDTDEIQSSATLQGFVDHVLTAPVDTTHLSLDNESPNAHNIIFAYRSIDGVLLLTLRSEWIFQSGIDTIIPQTWSIQLPINAVLHFSTSEEYKLSPEIDLHDDWLRNTNGYYKVHTNFVFYQNITVPTSQDSYTLVLFHTMPADYLQPDLSYYYQTFALLALGVMLCVIALALFSIDRFVEPIRQLKQSMDINRKTQKTPALPKRLPPDEIGELSLAFYTTAIELEAKRASERALVEKLITAQEEERKRIAYDLHDGLIQQLVGARFYLNQCKTDLSNERDAKSLDMFTQGYETLSSAIVEGRRIMQGLHPSILDDLGLTEALHELVHSNAKSANWQVQLELDEPTTDLDKIISVTLYRITQEALNNTYKHASATQIHMILAYENGIALTIKDNGCGFDIRQARSSSKGWGLRTMRERINLLDGQLQIESELDVGTVLTIWIPDKHNDKENSDEAD